MLQAIAATEPIFLTINLAKGNNIGNWVLGEENRKARLPSISRYISNSTILSLKGKKPGYESRSGWEDINSEETLRNDFNILVFNQLNKR